MQEVIHSLKTRCLCMLVKLDIRKAYDQVDWRFLCKVLEAFGFERQWVCWVFICISTLCFSILVNGESFGFFEAYRELYQDDLM